MASRAADGGSAGAEGVADELGHGVVGVVGLGAVEGELAEGSVSVLPGGEGQEGRGGGDVAGCGVAGEVGPQPQVGAGCSGCMRAQASSRSWMSVRATAMRASLSILVMVPPLR